MMVQGFVAGVSMRPFLHSLRRDWASWNRFERLAALGVFGAAPLTATALVVAMLH